LDKKKKIFETPSHCVSGPAIKATVKPSFFHLGAETWNQPSSTHPLYFSWGPQPRRPKPQRPRRPAAHALPPCLCQWNPRSVTQRNIWQKNY
jgi:hypothetical protein